MSDSKQSPPSKKQQTEEEQIRGFLSKRFKHFIFIGVKKEDKQGLHYGYGAVGDPVQVARVASKIISEDFSLRLTASWIAAFIIQNDLQTLEMIKNPPNKKMETVS